MKLTEEEQERTDIMCNLSDAIEAKGHSEGLTEGKNNYRVSIIRKKLMKGQSIEFIADDLDEDITVVRKVAELVENETV